MTSTPASPTARRRWRTPLTAAASAVVLAVLAACTGTGTVEEAAPSRDDLVVVVASLPRTTTGEPGVGHAASVQAKLLREAAVPAEDGNFTLDPYSFDPVLAEGYEVSEDGLTYTFTLKEDVVSPQGNPFTAEDVVWSFERHFKVPGSNGPAIFAPVITDPATQIVAVDDYTVSFTIPSAGMGLMLLSNLAQNGTIYDSAALLEHATAEDPYAVAWSLDNQNFGFGAYTVESYTPDQELVLTSNPDYVLGAPEITSITYRVVADPGARANALATGDADIAETLGSADLADLETAGTAQGYESSYRNTILTLSLLTTSAPLDNPLVREALSYAVPYEQILENVYAGRGVITDGRLDPEGPGYTDTGIPKSEYDPERSLELLEEAGFPDGVTITITVNSAISDTIAAAVQIQSFAKDAGFTVEINQLASAAFLEQRRAATLQSLIELIPATNASPAYQLRIFFEANALNRTKWVNQQFLDLINYGLQEGDETAQGVFFNKAEQILVNDHPSIWIVRPQPGVGYAPGLTGVLSTGSGSYDPSLLSW